MAIEFDHLFICTSSGAPEGSSLVAFGLAEGPPNKHPGQGTSCRRFFFSNAYLELLWVNDPAEAQSGVVRPTHLFERWAGRSTGVCPFGLGFRTNPPHDRTAPFSTWEYRPPYLPGSLSFQVATNAGVLAEPLLFHLPFGQRPDQSPREQRPPMEHRVGLGEVTRVELATPHADPRSPEFERLVSASLVRLRAGPEYLAELGFDGEAQGQRADFRPLLPLVFCW